MMYEQYRAMTMDQSVLTTDGKIAAKMKLVIPPIMTSIRNPKPKNKAIVRMKTLSALIIREELLLILFVLSYKSIQVTPISKSAT